MTTPTTNVTAQVEAAITEATSSIEASFKRQTDLVEQKKKIDEQLTQCERDRIYWLGRAHALQALVAGASTPPNAVPQNEQPAAEPAKTPETPPGGVADLIGASGRRGVRRARPRK